MGVARRPWYLVLPRLSSNKMIKIRSSDYMFFALWYFHGFHRWPLPGTVHLSSDLHSTLDPVEPLLVGSKVEHDDQGYGADDPDIEWTPATITKCHKNGTFDLLYDDASSPAYGEEEEWTEKYVRLNKTRNEIRLRRDRNLRKSLYTLIVIYYIT